MLYALMIHIFRWNNGFQQIITFPMIAHMACFVCNITIICKWGIWGLECAPPRYRMSPKGPQFFNPPDYFRPLSWKLHPWWMLSKKCHALPIRILWDPVYNKIGGALWYNFIIHIAHLEEWMHLVAGPRWRNLGLRGCKSLVKHGSWGAL